MQLVELGQQQNRAVDVMSTFYRPGSDWQSVRRRQRLAATPAAGGDEAAGGVVVGPLQTQPPEGGNGAWVQAQPPEGGTSSCGAWVRLGDCRSRMLHVVYDGKRLDEQVVSILCEGWSMMMHVPSREGVQGTEGLSLELRSTAELCLQPGSADPGPFMPSSSC